MSGELRETRCTARKEHGCDWCGERIPADSGYWRVVGFDLDGDFHACKMHEECHGAWAADCDGEWYPGGMVRGKYEAQ